jgi:hypothetical protein
MRIRPNPDPFRDSSGHGISFAISEAGGSFGQFTRLKLSVQVRITSFYAAFSEIMSNKMRLFLSGSPNEEANPSNFGDYGPPIETANTLLEQQFPAKFVFKIGVGAPA